MSRILRLVPLLAFLPFAALAQSGAPAVREGEAPKYPEIERGFFFGVGGGWSFVMNPPGPEGAERPFSPGTMARVEMGYDIGERLSLALFVMGTANNASAEYIGFSRGTSSGDFSALVPGATLRGNVVGFADSQQVRRTWLYLRGAAGYVLWAPKDLLPDSDILISAGPGVEYFTRLRHFSVGLEVLGNYMVNSGATGFSIVPNLRYAF